MIELKEFTCFGSSRFGSISGSKTPQISIEEILKEAYHDNLGELYVVLSGSALL